MSAMTKQKDGAWQTVAERAQKVSAAVQKFAEPMEPYELLKHMLATYRALRWVMFGMAAALPPLLVLYGLKEGVGFQHSLSAYFYADHDKVAALRTIFVGVLFALGAALIAYRGHSRLENWTLNFAGVAAVCVALLPMLWPECEPTGPECKPTRGSELHAISAQILFLLLGIVAVFCQNDTLRHLPKTADRNRKWFEWRYYYCTAAIMVFTPGLAWLFAQLAGAAKFLVIIMEGIGIWAFAAFWYWKSKEMGQSKFEDMVQRMKLESKAEAAKWMPPVGPQEHS